MACGEVSTRSQAKKDILNTSYIESSEFLNGVLPTKKNVIQNMLYLLRPKRAGQAQRSKEDAAQLLADLLQEHWLFCNLYTVANKNVKKHVLKLYEEFSKLVQTRKQRQNDNFKAKATEFNNSSDDLFDIFCTDPITRKKLEHDHGVKMTDMEWKFLEDQRTQRKMYCEDFVDKKWMKTMERRKRELDSLDNLRKTAEVEKETMNMRGANIDEESDDTNEAYDDNEMDFECGGESSSEEEFPEDMEKKKKRKRLFFSEPTCSDKDKMPYEYRHVRLSYRKIRPEFYETVDKLKSCYHMSESQAEASVVEVGNKMFGRTWKYHDQPDVIDLDTLPQSSNIRHAGKSIEAMALAEIVKEIIDSDGKSTVTYSNDGSKKQGAGSFTVQGIMINDKYRALPTMSIASESKRNLADLKLTTFSILEAASGVESKLLFEKIDFVITDQTAHNFGVEELVAEDLDAESIPDHLFCNVHPTLMFNRILTKHWAEIENAIGRDKIYSNFLVNATTQASTVTEQALDCTTRLINHDFDHKSWNKSNEFDIHISPKRNKSVSLKDERFNRLTLTCAITLYHYDDVMSFLEKYEHVTNKLACIVRCFLDLEFMKILYVVGALIGIHLVEPFLSLTTSSKTKYSKLIPAFKQLYKDLKDTDPNDLLRLDKPAFSFISDERFKNSKYDEDICDVIQRVSQEYKPEVCRMLKILLPTLAEGFKAQKGKIFEFGQEETVSDGAVNAETYSLALSKMDKEKLEQAPIHNIAAERSVGFVNYELSQRGAKQLGSASSAQVKAKSADLIESTPSGSFRKFGKIDKKGGIIPELILHWNTKQQELKEKGLTDKEIGNLAVDRRKNKDLETLKSQGGPFTASKDIDPYIASNTIDSQAKVNRLYLEVRYARDTSLSLPKTSDIFRLMMKDHKKLPLETYVTNLKLYLENVVCKADVTLMDLNEALMKIKV